MGIGEAIGWNVQDVLDVLDAIAALSRHERSELIADPSIEPEPEPL